MNTFLVNVYYLKSQSFCSILESLLMYFNFKIVISSTSKTIIIVELSLIILAISSTTFCNILLYFHSTIASKNDKEQIFLFVFFYSQQYKIFFTNCKAYILIFNLLQGYLCKMNYYVTLLLHVHATSIKIYFILISMILYFIYCFLVFLYKNTLKE